MKSAIHLELEKDCSQLIEAGELLSIKNDQGKQSGLTDISELIGYKGNIKSKIAIVTYNSKTKSLPRTNKLSNITTADHHLQKDCIDSDTMGEGDSESAENIKLCCYLKPFRVIRFDNESHQRNLSLLAEQKFHIDLSSFDRKSLSSTELLSDHSLLNQFVDVLLCLILAHPRQYVIFIGDSFKEILSDFIEDSDRFSFLLTSPNKVNQKNTAHFTRITIKYKGKQLIAGIAESYFDENLDNVMIEKYGQESVYLINRGLLLAKPMWNSNFNLTK